MCLFCKIADGEIPSQKVYEDERILAFRDINPQAPVHVLVIPKQHIGSVDEVNHENSAVVAYIFEKIPEIANTAGLTNGYRIISNVGEDGCQSVHHMHFHILGGKKLVGILSQGMPKPYEASEKNFRWFLECLSGRSMTILEPLFASAGMKPEDLDALMEKAYETGKSL